MNARGAVAAGHEETARAAVQILQDGGNAFDAILAGLCAACVVEPQLASLGGGGFLAARPAAGRLEGREIVYDFFVQTPKRKLDERDADFRPVLCDFGTATQEFHVGFGSMAAPGVPRGLFEIHEDLGRVPMRDVAAPAIRLAREGVAVNAMQAFIYTVVGPIFSGSPAALAIHGSPSDPETLIREGEILVQPELADALEVLAIEGADLFHRGEIAARIAEASASGGGHLAKADLEDYQVERRRPLGFEYRGAHLATNPPPSTGGVLIAFALEMMRGLAPGAMGSAEHMARLAHVMDIANRARRDGPGVGMGILDSRFLDLYRNEAANHPQATRGTTHLGVVDADGALAALTVSNGEGCGFVIPGTGIMMNNMLGEEDLNPAGFHNWDPDVRMASMMAPTLALLPGGERYALGSGGSNRIRTAIQQVLANMLDFGAPPDVAVEVPRIHLEGEHLSIEPGLGEDALAALKAAWPDHREWEAKNMFFGGAHVVGYDPRTKGFGGAGDSRRAGVFMLA